MGKPNACLKVPYKNVAFTCGKGAVEGASLTTAGDIFLHATDQIVQEAKSDVRVVSEGVLANVAKNGLFVGTMGTAQTAAEGGVQLYAGASVTVKTGSADGPTPAYQPSKPPKVEAGNTANQLNAFNDGIKAVGKIGASAHDYKSAADAADGFKAVQAAYSGMRGAWDLWKVSNPDTAKSIGADATLGAADVVMKTAGALQEGSALGVIDALGASIGLGAGVANAQNAADAGKAFDKAKAGQASLAASGEAAGGIAGPVDGPRIHQVAPNNIDRECGASLTAKVGGDKTSLVDGKVETKSGQSITMKAFNKVETSSKYFSAHANIGAVMMGLATAKLDSLGATTVRGRTKFSVTTTGKGTVTAKAGLTLESSTQIVATAGSITLDATNFASLNSKQTRVHGTDHVEIETPKLIVTGKSELEDDVVMKKKLEVKKPVTFRAKLSGQGATIKGTIKLG